jgi:hypothetical protein
MLASRASADLRAAGSALIRRFPILCPQPSIFFGCAFAALSLSLLLFWAGP